MNASPDVRRPAICAMRQVAQGKLRHLVACAGLIAVCWAVAVSAADAQLLPSRPVTLLKDRLVVSGELSASVAPSDDGGYDDLTNYGVDLLRMAEFRLDASLQMGGRAVLVGGLAGQTAIDRWKGHLYPSALYIALRPSAAHSLTFAAGILPPVFGAFLRNGYASATDNPLIGYPLAYQYATSIRPDAFPASADDLVRLRGLGEVAGYPIGDGYAASGLPLVNPFGWNAGVRASAGAEALHVTAALTEGGIANRRGSGQGGGREGTVRVEARLGAALRLGGSVAYGSYLDKDASALARTAVQNRHPRERALGIDAEYSRDYWLVRGEVINSRRDVPAFRAPFLADPLMATWVGVETRYRFLPGLSGAVRVERLVFNRIATSTSTSTWDADVTRVEVGAIYALNRNLLAKLAWQRSARDSTRYPRQQLVAAQMVLWF